MLSLAEGEGRNAVFLLREVEREVREGSYHTGLASVVQLIGKRR